jgi:hypothetical protein
MKRILISLVAALLFVSMLLTVPVSASLSTVKWITPDKYKPALDDYAYSFAIVGDTQILVREDAGTFAANKYTEFPDYTSKVYDWIIDNVEKKKIAYVMGLGDICEMSYEPKEWEVAQKQIFRLNGVVPYSLVRGNHDSSVLLNYFFNSNLEYNKIGFAEQFDGFYDPKRIEDSYMLAEFGNDKYLLITLDYGATDDVLNWANGIIEAHPDRRVIVTTHGYIGSGGQVMDDEDLGFGTPMQNNGIEMWEKCFSKHKNMLMVVCGHVGVDGIVSSYKNGVNGNRVLQVLVDPQGLDTSSPTGLILIMNFSADGRTISMEYFSTIKGKYVRGMQSQKTIGSAKPLISSTTLATTTTVEETTAITEEEKNGCGSAIASTVSVACMLGSTLAVFALRKKDRD